MKYSFSLLIFSLLIFQKSNAQDTILKVNGDTVFAKIIEINADEIKFKRFNFLDGPTYIENKSGVKLIKYSNGMKEVIVSKEIKSTSVKPISNNDDFIAPEIASNKINEFEKHYSWKGNAISEEEMQLMLMKTRDKKIMPLVEHAKKAKKLQSIGFGVIPFAFGAVIALPYYAMYDAGYKSNKGGKYTSAERDKYAAISGLCIAGSIVCPVISGVFSAKRKFYNHKAIQLYNQKF